MIAINLEPSTANPYNKWNWHQYIKNPIKNYNGYITTVSGLYKIVTIRLGRHFSYLEISRVGSKGNLDFPIYLSVVGSDWKDTSYRLAARLKDYLNDNEGSWVNLGEISC